MSDLICSFVPSLDPRCHLGHRVFVFARGLGHCRGQHRTQPMQRVGVCGRQHELVAGTLCGMLPGFSMA